MLKDSRQQRSALEANKNTNALVFISHDSRDAEIADAFSSLIRKVSAGLLKCFYSSDKKAERGIPYGEEWYREIILNLQQASNVLCILTHRSMGRPWILYEAGIARGSSSQSVLAIAIGIQSSKASSGPFSQLQNCGDDEESLIKLILQLLKQSIPECDPDMSLIKSQVRAFRRKIRKFLEHLEPDETLSSEDERSSRYVAEFVEKMKRGVVDGLSCADLGGRKDKQENEIDELFSSFILHPAENLKRFFSFIDKQFRERISESGTLVRLSKPTDFSSATLVGSLLQLGLPLSLSLHVPVNVVDILEAMVKEGLIECEVTSSDIRTAVVRSFDRLQANPEFPPERIEFTKSAYIRRYGNPDNQYLKVIDYGIERDLNYNYINKEIIPHLLRRIFKLDSGEDPLNMYGDLFSSSRLREMAKEIMHFSGQLNLYSIRYKSLIHLIQEVTLQPPHPWIVSKETEARVFQYNLERMEAHHETVTDSPGGVIDSSNYHAFKEFFQHASAAILAKYGAFLGVGSQYGLNELNRILALVHNNIALWDYCRLCNLDSDLVKGGMSIAVLRQSAKKVQQLLTSSTQSENIKVSSIQPEINIFKSIILYLSSLPCEGYCQ